MHGREELHRTKPETACTLHGVISGTWQQQLGLPSEVIDQGRELIRRMPCT